MDVITYSLRDGQAQSNRYYRDVAIFADEVLTEAESRIRLLVDAFQFYVERIGRETLHTRPEYVFELLTLGVLWLVYAGDALGLAKAPRQALTSLVRLRQRGDCLKPGADFLRGVLATLFLSPDGRYPAETLPLTLDHLDRLLDWLAAAGDFDQEVKRMRAWQDFFSGQQPEEAIENLAVAVSFATWFEARSEAVLGRYTRHVERFLTEAHPSYRWREDVIFCGRQQVEYHLNMVGTEILNRAFREAFLGTARKLVLLPPCMKAQPGDKCQARPTPFGARCAGCTPGCRVLQLTGLGKELGFEIFILPDELSVFSSGAVRPVDDGAVGIVGVSCVLTNPTGGWETKDLGLPAQGGLLDYCGCRYHWHEKGIPTDINTGQLLRVLGLNMSKPREVRDEEWAPSPRAGAGARASPPRGTRK